MPTDDFTAIFKKLKAILKKHEKRFVVEVESDTEYYLNSKQLDQKKKPIFFAATGINKISVSFYLMAVDTDPKFRSSVSPQLHKHLHGKCCFRFKRNEPALFKELEALAKRAVEKCKSES